LSKPIDNRSRSILSEINSYVPNKSKKELIEVRAQHAISSAIYLLSLLEENYTEEEAEILTKRFLNSVKTKDTSKFTKALRRMEK
jgi:hypothetical protein